MKHNIYCTIILILALINGISCNKSFLDVEDNTVILREQYVKDANTLQQYVNGIYILLARDFYNGASGSQIYTDLTADNIKPNSTNTTTLTAQYNWKQSSSTANSSRSNMANLWINGYSLIRSCNFVIEKSNEIKNENELQITQLRGEAYGIRALVHFVLVNTFAQSYNYSTDASHLGVPYITSWDWNDGIVRNTVKEVYDGMIKDLTIAMPLLPVSNSNKLIMNQYAAKALLARIFLFKEDWSQAKAFAKELTDAIPLLPTASYPSKLFTQEETEAFFQLAPSSTIYINGSYSTAFQGFYYRSTAFIATKDIANILTLNSNDRRKSWISTSSMGKDSIRKYPIDVLKGFGDGTNPNRSYFQTLFRSSEMYLTVAEATARMNDETSARQYLDAIRQRADPTAINSTASGTSLLDSIYLERRKELAFEGLRMWDLQRWKKGVLRTDAIAGAPLALPYPSDKAIAPLPIQDENYGLPQNPTY